MSAFSIENSHPPRLREDHFIVNSVLWCLLPQSERPIAKQSSRFSPHRLLHILTQNELLHSK